MSTSLETSAPHHDSRCCAGHADWPTLAQHLLDQFPEATITDVVRAVHHARDAVQADAFEERAAVELGEDVARAELSLLTGRA